MRRTLVSATTLLSCTLLWAALPGCERSRPGDHHRPEDRDQPAAATTPAGADDRRSAKWEKQVAAYEAMDRDQPPPKNAILFIGSSTIRRWDTLDKDFPDHRVINRGFGGSHIADSTRLADRLIFPHEPRIIVLRAGGNDLHAGKSPEQVFEDYKAFVAKVHDRLPQAEIVYISTNPTPARWDEWGATQALNALIEGYARQRPLLKYVEIADMVLGPDGLPRPELFADRLHFNAEGYRLLADRVRPLLPSGESP